MGTEEREERGRSSRAGARMPCTGPLKAGPAGALASVRSIPKEKAGELRGSDSSDIARGFWCKGAAILAGAYFPCDYERVSGGSVDILSCR